MEKVRFWQSWFRPAETEPPRPVAETENWEEDIFTAAWGATEDSHAEEDVTDESETTAQAPSASYEERISQVAAAEEAFGQVAATLFALFDASSIVGACCGGLFHFHALPTGGFDLSSNHVHDEDEHHHHHHVPHFLPKSTHHNTAHSPAKAVKTPQNKPHHPPKKSNESIGLSLLIASLASPDILAA